MATRHLSSVNPEVDFRLAEDSDTPAIVHLLKTSLGESLLPKSEAFWRWKHEQNPFGRSPVLLACQESEVLGVRAFLQWQWCSGQETYRALRAVDTAVHPRAQGKGLFTRLTRYLLAECQQQGYDLVFNTPNANSLPGYLKMGWVRAGRMPLTVRPLFRWPGKKWVLASAQGALDQFQGWGGVVHEGSALVTPASRDFFHWRYVAVPGIPYFGWCDDTGHHLFFFRMKEHTYFTELRVVDVVTDRPAALAQAWRSFYRQLPVPRPVSWVTLAGGWPRLPLGPLRTLRALRDPIDLVGFQKKWRPSLGDIELF